jgi:hypothetical protein
VGFDQVLTFVNTAPEVDRFTDHGFRGRGTSRDLMTTGLEIAASGNSPAPATTKSTGRNASTISAGVPADAARAMGPGAWA